ncbi:hypothetical protein [Oenococcus oeni]|uniref:hypothetical protein n=1 Tax=Oenococcus oeni TaxID=1247 RepID=UPI0008F8DA55|nr:hypothetical protein [Oenococcus oeni]OIL89939.1 hypothetical protein ATX41_04170 [Oenococcus oeni]
MSNELQIVDTNGEVLSIDNVITKLNDKAYLASLADEQIEQLAYIVQSIKSPTKKIDDELKTRLVKGNQFNHISLTEYQRTTIKDTEENRNTFYKKYGLDAFVFRTPAQLKKKFGESIQDDLDKVIVCSTQNRVKYD